MTVEELEIIVKANIKNAMSGIKQVVQEVRQAVKQTIEPTQKIVSSVQQIANSSASSFSSASVSVSKYKNEIKSTVAQQEFLTKKINDLKSSLNFENSNKIFSSDEILEMRVEVEKLEKQLYNLQNVGKNVDVSMHSNNTSKSINKAIGSVKKFALSLFGIQTIMSGISRATSAYSQIDESYANKMQSIWIGLGAMLAPAVEYIINILLHGLAYVNAFVKALTGIDYIAKANAKALDKQSKATKNLANSNKQLSSIDGDIVNLSDEKTAGTGTSAEIPKIETPVIDTSGVERFVTFIKEKVVPAVESIYESFKTGWEATKTGFGAFCVGLQAILVVTFYAFLGIIEGVLEIIRGVILGVVSIILGIIEGAFEIIKGTVLGLIQIFSGVFNGIWQIISGVFTNIFNMIKGVFEGVIQFIVGIFTGNWKSALDGLIKVFSSIWNGIKGIVSSVFNGIVTIVRGILEGLWTFIKGVAQGIADIFTGIVKGIGNVFIGIANGVISVINGFIKGLNKIKIPDWVPAVGGKGFYISEINKIHYLEKGGVATGSIFANIGEGKYQEAVVPLGSSPQFRNMKEDIADYVSDRQGGSIENLTIQVGAEKLYDDVIDYINAKTQRLGRSVIKVGV